VKAAEIPALTLTGGVTVKVISGTVAGTQGPVRDIVTDPEFLDVTIPAGASVTHAVKPGYTVFAYVIDGAGHFDNGGDLFDTGSVILYEPDGDSITVTATAQPVHFFLCAGKPLGEPIAWQGPIVMNTQEELRTAFQEFHNGTFVK
ncbi:MAG TPA: pirin-like C-terminal cupin domain-containing protein, partial [Armatimonadota bacterium]